MQKNNTQKTKSVLTLSDVAQYRKQIEVLEGLIRQRDEISERIQQINEVLYGGLKLDKLGGQLHDCRKNGSITERLIAACKGGATKLEVTKALGLTPKTVEIYLYSNKMGGKVLDRTRVDGVSIWTPKA